MNKQLKWCVYYPKQKTLNTAIKMCIQQNECSIDFLCRIPLIFAFYKYIIKCLLLIVNVIKQIVYISVEKIFVRSNGIELNLFNCILQVLHLHVFDYDRFSRDDSIGEVFLPLCQVSDSMSSSGK